MILGTDTSSYQPLGSYDPGAFEIINALDPTLPAKVGRNRAEARPWGVYSWVFPGEPGSYPVGRAISAIAKVGGGNPPLGTWWDYEDNGVVQTQLDQAFATADGEGLWSGYYANDHRVDHGPLLARPYWLAAYPGNNDGSFPGFDKMRASRPVNLWQFTSTNGTLDQNVVVDEAWYQAVTGGVPAPPTPPQLTEDPMLIRRAETGPDGSNQPAGHTELLDGFGGAWWEPAYDALPNVVAVSNVVWDQVHGAATTRGAQLSSAAGDTGQGTGPSDAQRAAVAKAVSVLSANGANEAEAARDLATAFG